MWPVLVGGEVGNDQGHRHKALHTQSLSSSYLGPNDRLVGFPTGHQTLPLPQISPSPMATKPQKPNCWVPGVGNKHGGHVAYLSADFQVAVSMGKALLEFVWALRFHVDM